MSDGIKMRRFKKIEVKPPAPSSCSADDGVNPDAPPC